MLAAVRRDLGEPGVLGQQRRLRRPLRPRPRDPGRPCAARCSRSTPPAPRSCRARALRRPWMPRPASGRIVDHLVGAASPAAWSPRARGHSRPVEAHARAVAAEYAAEGVACRLRPGVDNAVHTAGLRATRGSERPDPRRRPRQAPTRCGMVTWLFRRSSTSRRRAARRRRPSPAIALSRRSPRRGSPVSQPRRRARRENSPPAAARSILAAWTGTPRSPRSRATSRSSARTRPRPSRSTCATSGRCARTCAAKRGGDAPLARLSALDVRGQLAALFGAQRRRRRSTAGCRACARSAGSCQARRDRGQPGRRDPRAEEAPAAAARARRRRRVPAGRGAGRDRAHQPPRAVGRRGRAPRRCCGCATPRCWSCCTAPACGWPSCARSTPPTSIAAATACAMLMVRRGKGGKSRQVPIGGAADRALAAYLPARAGARGDRRGAVRQRGRPRG